MKNLFKQALLTIFLLLFTTYAKADISCPATPTVVYPSVLVNALDVQSVSN